MSKYPPLFSDAVCAALGNYVYRLIDPRNGDTFYVGKGKDNRVFSHVEASKKPAGTHDEVSLKLDRIREIHDAGLEVIHVIHRHKIPDGSVFQVEAALIDAYQGLTNIQGGVGSDSFGPAHVQEITDRYALPSLNDVGNRKLVLININNLQDRSDRRLIYDQVRLAWRLSPSKARKADFVLAVVRGVVVGAFEAHEWLQATPENFSELPPARTVPDRWGFRGQPADDATWDFFVGKRGKRIDDPKMRHHQNPVRYWNL